MNCSKCGVEYDDSYRFCPNCGAPAAKMTQAKQIRCPNCMKAVDSSYDFCPICGTSVKRVNSQPNPTNTSKKNPTNTSKKNPTNTSKKNPTNTSKNPTNTSATKIQDLSAYVFILLAVNVFTALSFVFNIVEGGKETFFYGTTKVSIYKVFKFCITERSFAGFNGFWGIATVATVAITIIVSVVCVLMALGSYFTKKDNTTDLLETLNKLYSSSIAVVVQLSAVFIFVEFILPGELKQGYEYSFTIWFWLLAGAAVISMFVERSILKANGCLSDANTPVANNTKK